MLESSVFRDTQRMGQTCMTPPPDEHIALVEKVSGTQIGRCGARCHERDIHLAPDHLFFHLVYIKASKRDAYAWRHVPEPRNERPGQGRLEVVRTGDDESHIGAEWIEALIGCHCRSRQF